MSAPKSHPPSEWASARPLGHDVYWLPIWTEEGLDYTLIWHWCTRDNIDGEPRWTSAATTAHKHISFNPLHLEPSLACADCPFHGFVRDGKWSPV